MYIKFQKLLMTGCRDMDKKHQKYPQKWGFSQICDPQDFFQKSGSVIFVLLWCPNFMQKIKKKTNGRSLRYLKTDGWTGGQMDWQRDRGDYIYPPRINQGPIQIAWILLKLWYPLQNFKVQWIRRIAYVKISNVEEILIQWLSINSINCKQ